MIKVILKKIYYKTKLDVLFGYILSWITKITWKPFTILTADDTVDYILKQHCSLARFGDGELQILAYGTGLKFQRADKKLQKRLQEIAASETNANLLIGLPDRLNIINNKQRRELSEYWQKSLREHLYFWTKYFTKNRIYGNTNMTRIADCFTNEGKINQVNHIRKIWENRSVILVEGDKTRFGVGNDLLKNAKSVTRILGPAESAFDKYDEIINATINLAKGKEDIIVLVALGPTATVLSYDLANIGIQTIDIGHLDICYEQLRIGNNKVAISGKYTNEVSGGNNVSECTDINYLKDIYCKIL